jgi:AraC-like DNA-binding protein
VGFTFPQWQGFERAPEGALLEAIFDLDAEMGVVYERSIDFYKDFHRHARLMFVFPRGGCVMRDRTRDPAGEFVTDWATFLVMPHRLAHEVQCMSSVFDTLLLFPSAALLAKVAREEALAGTPRFGPGATKLRRSPWLDRLLLEYFARRVLAGLRPARLRLFEEEIVREVLALAGLASRGAGAVQAAPGGVAERALQLIEANLFAPLELGDIARKAHASVPTLLRHFKRVTGRTPFQYIQGRRLDEARSLLGRGTHNVTEVAMLVGYQNAGAFSEAFRARFKKPPSRLRR